jgi:hypothetical protein
MMIFTTKQSPGQGSIGVFQQNKGILTYPVTATRNCTVSSAVLLVQESPSTVLPPPSSTTEDHSFGLNMQTSCRISRSCQTQDKQHIGVQHKLGTMTVEEPTLPTRRRRVCFDTKEDKVHLIQVMHAINNTDENDTNDANDFWWTSKELAHIHLRSRAQADQYGVSHKHYKHSLIQVLKAVHEEERLPEHTASVTADNLLVQQQAVDYYNRHVTALGAAEVRGLESGVIPQIRLYRKKHAHTVLTVQRNLREFQADKAYMAFMLSVRSQQTSRFCRLLAIKLAKADRQLQQQQDMADTAGA